MQIMAVLSYMGIEASLSWSNDSPYSQDYDKDIDINKIPVKYNEGFAAPTNEDFHKAAEELASLHVNRDLKLQKLSEYPDITEWLLALTEELGILADRFEIPQAVSFLAVRGKIKQIDDKYSNHPL